MNTSYKTQIEVIQEMRRTVNVMVELGLIGTDNANRVNATLNDCGSTIAALNLSDPYKEIERLNNWKESMLKLWSPVIDWMQTKSNLGLGEDISVEVLKRVQEYESLKQQLKEANEIISHYADVNQNQ